MRLPFHVVELLAGLPVLRQLVAEAKARQLPLPRRGDVQVRGAAGVEWAGRAGRMVVGPLTPRRERLSAAQGRTRWGT